MSRVVLPESGHGLHACQNMGGHIAHNGTSRSDRVGALEPLVERSAEAEVANPIFPRADAFSGI
eukprot:13414940-Alexandrium_andersonii.AAC.1